MPSSRGTACSSHVLGPSWSASTPRSMLMRATQGHPALDATVAAWRQVGRWDPDELLDQLEDMVAEARSAGAGGRGASRAWVVAEAGQFTADGVGAAPQGGVSSEHQVASDAWYGAGPQWNAWAIAAAAQQLQQSGAPADGAQADPRKCYACGKPGHIRRNCPSARGATQADASAELLTAVRELTDMLRSKK